MRQYRAAKAVAALNQFLVAAGRVRGYVETMKQLADRLMVPVGRPAGQLLVVQR